MDSSKPVRPARRSQSDALLALNSEIITCRACARLVTWRESVASTPRPSFGDEPYWARALPGFGDPSARLLLVGLAPAAHGGNRTGRMFTGDRSGDFLFAALHRAGFASSPFSTGADDGLILSDAYITAAVRCAPPDNRPTPAERTMCSPYLGQELAILSEVRVVLALGAFALDALFHQPLIATRLLGQAKRPKFAHAAEFGLAARRPEEAPATLMCSYHPSQRNVFTGLLTAAMFDQVLERARQLCAQRAISSS